MNAHTLDRFGDPRARLRVVHVTAPARAGGLERVVRSLAAGHAASGTEVHVVAVIEGAGDADHLLSSMAAHGVVPHPLVVPGRAYRREYTLLRALCRKIGPSVVHTHGYRADVIAGHVARALGIASVTTVHGFTGGGWRNRLYEALQIRAFRKFDAVVAVSRPLVELLRRRGVPSQALRLIVNASGPNSSIERPAARARLGLDDSAFRLGWIGRLSREKGADIFIEALSRLPREFVGSMVGDGREREALVALATTRGVADRVRWHGIVSDAGELIKAFDAFVLSSRTEGTPMTLLEAMDAGVPIVATRVGGVPDVVTDAEALLVPPENPGAIASAVTAVRDDPAAAATRAAAARQRLDSSFALRPWLDAYDQVYRQVMR